MRIFGIVQSFKYQTVHNVHNNQKKVKTKMPKITTAKKRIQYDELNDLKRNLKKMSREDIEAYIVIGDLRKVLGKRFREKVI